MGTKHSTMVIAENEVCIAQYGQWDGYPSGQGLTVLEFLKNADLKKFREQCLLIQEVTEEELSTLWVKCGANPKSNFVNMDVSEKFKKKYPEFHRDTGAQILNLVHRKGVKKVELEKDFMLPLI